MLDLRENKIFTPSYSTFVCNGVYYELCVLRVMLCVLFTVRLVSSTDNLTPSLNCVVDIGPLNVPWWHVLLCAVIDLSVMNPYLVLPSLELCSTPQTGSGLLCSLSVGDILSLCLG